MKQIKINKLWTTSVSFHTIYDFWYDGFEEGDIIEFSWSDEVNQKVSIYKNNKLFNNEAKGISKPTNITKDNKISFGSMREKIELGLYMGLLVPQGTFDPKVKKDFVGKGYKFFVRKVNKTDWIFNYLDKNEGIDPFNDLSNSINSIILRNIWVYKREKFRDMIPVEVDPFLTLLLLKRNHKFTNLDTVINNVKSYPKIYSDDKNNLTFLNQILEKYDISIDESIFKYDEIIKLKYSSIFNMLDLTNNEIKNQKLQTSFQNDPWLARKIMQEFQETVAITLSVVGDKYELQLNDIAYHKGTRSTETIFWNLWGLILNGNFELKYWMLGKTMKEFVESFVGKTIIAKSFQSINVIKENYSLMRDHKESYISATTISFFVNGYKNLITPTNVKKDRSIESKKFVEDFNKYEFNIKKFASFEKREQTEKYDTILRLRHKFSKNVENQYESIMKQIDGYTSVRGMKFESTDKAHIFEVSEAKKIEDYDSIVDHNNCLLLSPNIHRLWDKGYLRIRPDGKIITNDEKFTKYEIEPSELNNQQKIKYLEIRYLMDIEKNSQKKLSSDIHFIKNNIEIQ